jgi:hypothetical protein
MLSKAAVFDHGSNLWPCVPARHLASQLQVVQALFCGICLALSLLL